MVNKIAGNFSRCSKFYDDYCGLQNKAAAELINLIRGKDFYDILEVGCGTGNYTHMLRHEFRSARIRAFDISEGMVEVARNKLKDRDIDFKIADAHLHEENTKFDLITSNACFQWLNNLEQVLACYSGLLQDCGAIVFSTFGPETFYELSSTLDSVFKRSQISSTGFSTAKELEKNLKQNFRSVSLKEIYYKEKFNTLKGLLEKIKYSGIRGKGLDKGVFFTRKTLSEIEKFYLEKFGCIQATYQVIYCYGEK